MAPERASRCALGLVVLAAFALALTKIDDPDAWTHLALGREMVARHGFPATEPFSLPSLGMPYYNTEWLFDIVLFLATLAGGLTGVIVVKAAVVALTFWVLWRDARVGDPAPDASLHVLLRAAIFFQILLMVRHRFVERPDIVLALFLAFTIYALNAFVARSSRLLYLVPAVQILWSNMHPSLLVGVVPFVAVLAAGLAPRLVPRWRWLVAAGTPSPAQLRRISWVFAAFLLAGVVNPYGFDAFTLPFRLADSTWLRQSIVELQPPRLGQDHATFVVIGLLVAVFLLTARRVRVVDVLLVVPFVCLALTAVRFFFLLAIVAAPILSRQLCLAIGSLEGALPRRVGGAAAVAAAGAGALAIALVVASVEPFVDARKVPGFGFNERVVPEAALRYLDRAGIDGRVYNTFQWGGFILWRDFPRRVPIIDGRGYVPPGLIEEIAFARGHPEHLERLHDAYGVDIAVINYPVYVASKPLETGGRGAGASDVDLALTSPRWALVYWDDVALVYLRRSDRFAALIARDQYRYVKPGNPVPSIRQVLSDRGVAVQVVEELRRNVTETGSAIGHILLGFSAVELGNYDLAIEALSRVHDEQRVPDVYQGLALAYQGKGNLAEAVRYYRRLLEFGETAPTLFNAGLALVQMGRDREALPYLERARDVNPGFRPVYPLLIDAYRRLGQTRQAEALAPALRDLETRERVDRHLQTAFELRRQGKGAEAAAELTAALALVPDDARILNALGDLSSSEGRLGEAVAHYRAAVRARSDFAPAHYGLARASQQLGDERAATEHYREYVRLAPKTYLAWRARQELARPR